MQIKTRSLIIGLLLLLSSFLIGGYFWGRHREKVDSRAMERAYLDTMSYYKVKFGEKTLYVAQVEQELMTSKEAVRQGNIERRELKKLNLRQATEINRLELRIDTLLADVSHTGEVIVIHDTVVGQINQKAILLPFWFEKSDKWLHLRGNFDKDGKLDIILGVDFKADLWAGVDRTTRQNKALLTTDCPYIRTVSFNSIKLDSPKERRYGIGFQIGYGVCLTKQISTAPYVGIGVSYNLFRF